MITIDTASPVPPFEQLRAQIVAAVRSGELAPGARLPTVRRLAADLDLAPGTVARAYRELEASHVVETRGRGGTVVSEHGDAAQRAAQRAAAAYAEQARAQGLSPEDALRLVRSALGLTGTP